MIIAIIVLSLCAAVLGGLCIFLAMDRAKLKERVALEAEREALAEKFKAIAGDVLQNNAEQLRRNSISSLQSILAPMQNSFDAFTKGYRECYDIENRDRMSLREEIRSLHELNTRVGDETKRLTSALKGDTRFQGQWGEMILSNILEHSGLEQSRWFVTQESTTTGEHSSLRPDAVIHCPRQRDIIIDSKVSLTDYLRMLEADSPVEREQLAKAHVRSVENHVRELRGKEYQDNIGAKKGDFVLMFLPHEGAYLQAMSTNPELWMKAYDAHVIIVSPTHLVTVVRLVEQMWQTEDQTVNSLKIAETATKMINSVNAFFDDMADVGKALEKAQNSYASAAKRLKSGNNNVLRVAQELERLGIRSKKPLPQNEADNSVTD